MAQWLKLYTSNAGDPGSTPGKGARSHMPQLKILHATTKTPLQPNKYMNMREKKKNWQIKMPHIHLPFLHELFYWEIKL